MPRVEAHGPGIPPAPGCSGLPRHPRRPAAGEGLHQDGGDGVRRAAFHRLLRFRVGAGCQAQRHRPAMVGDRGVERGHLPQRRARAAEGERQRRIRPARQPRPRARRLQRRGEAQRADLVEQRHRRQVQRHPQRIRRRHAAGEVAREILRRIGAEMARQVGDQRARLRDPAFEGHRIQERLQRGPRRAHRARQVQRAGARFRTPFAADQGAHLPRRDIRDHDGERGAVGQGGQDLGGEAFRRALQRRIEGQRHAARRAARHLSRQVRREAGHRQAPLRHRCGQRQVAIRRRQPRRRPAAPRQHGIARGAGGIRVPVRAQGRGASRQRHQQR